MRRIKDLILGMIYSFKLFFGILIYLISKKSPPFGYQGMIGLFCLTGGISNDWLSRFLGIFRPVRKGLNMPGVLGNTSDTILRKKIAAELREKGFYIFKDRLPSDLCDRLLQFALSAPAQVAVMDGDKNGKPRAAVYRREAPEAVRYDFKSSDLLANGDVQTLLADLSFAAIAQEYLRAYPLVDVLTMWWHTAYSDKPDMNAAQYFHFDMDRPKWLKYFIYLTDVKPENGPHAFVAGSQRTGSIPGPLLRKGYTRLTDEEVASHFPKESFMEFSAPRGTVIAEDTRGLHKGRHVEKGDRLVLQIQFSNSLFGGFYPKDRIREIRTPELKARIEKFPGLYATYL